MKQLPTTPMAMIAPIIKQRTSLVVNPAGVNTYTTGVGGALELLIGVEEKFVLPVLFTTGNHHVSLFDMLDCRASKIETDEEKKN